MTRINEWLHWKRENRTSMSGHKKEKSLTLVWPLHLISLSLNHDDDDVVHDLFIRIRTRVEFYPWNTLSFIDFSLSFSGVNEIFLRLISRMESRVVSWHVEKKSSSTVYCDSQFWLFIPTKVPLIMIHLWWLSSWSSLMSVFRGWKIERQKEHYQAFLVFHYFLQLPL